MNATNKIFTTTDKARIMCAIWDNVNAPIGVVQIIHGIFDGISAYDKLARCMNRNGYIVFGVDKMLNKSPRTFERAVAQECDILQYLAAKYELPVFVIGYGYGGFVAQSVSRSTTTPIAAVCLIKSAARGRITLKIARAIARIGAFCFGANANARIINFIKRRHCGHTQTSPICTYEFCKSLFDGMIKLDSAGDFDNPILVISGATEHDQSTAQFSRALYNAYHNNNLLNTTLLIYPDMQNNFLMEMNCGRVQDDILSFLNESNGRYSADMSANVNGTIFNKSDGAT
jgi:alpha-beta hydrolase superfamily lysophospholipase